MRILALETSSASCACALLRDDVLEERQQTASRDHTRLLLPMIDELLSDAGCTLDGLDAIAFGRGPGSFTGVRIATSVAQGLALGSGCPLVPVSSLAALAQGIWRTHGCERVLAGFDARMGEVYLGTFAVGENGLMGALGLEQVGPPQRVPVPVDGEWHGAGSAWAEHGEALAERLGSRMLSVHAGALPGAGDVARLAAASVAAGDTEPPERALPSYLRNEVATPRSTPANRA